VREPEGIETPLPGRSSEKDLVITPRTRRSQCRGRGFESLTSTGPKALVRGGFPTRSATMDL
jgi:hypothetical protein